MIASIRASYAGNLNRAIPIGMPPRSSPTGIIPRRMVATSGGSEDNFSAMVRAIDIDVYYEC